MTAGDDGASAPRRASPRLPAAFAVLAAASAAATLVLATFPLGVWAALHGAALGACALAALRPAWRRRGAAFALAATMASVTTCAADTALRPVCGVWPHYRPEDAFLERDPAWPSLHRFAPGAAWRGTVWGDTAAAVAEPSLREPRVVDFVTDELGFRNPPGARAGPVDVLVVGDSFGAGCGSPQDALVARRIEAHAGVRAYDLSVNGSGPCEETGRALASGPDVTLAPGAAIVWLLYAGNDLDDAATAGDAAPPVRASGLERFRTWRNGRARRSPVRAAAEALLARPSAGTADPGSRPSKVVSLPLAGGGTMAFFRSQLAQAAATSGSWAAHAGVRPLAASIGRMHAAAGARGARVVLVCVPTKADVYGALCGETPPAGAGLGSAFASIVRREAERLAIPCIDLLPILRAEAEVRARSGAPPLWWRDDTHWSPAGQDVAAREIVRAALGAVRPGGGETPR